MDSKIETQNDKEAGPHSASWNPFQPCLAVPLNRSALLLGD